MEEGEKWWEECGSEANGWKTEPLEEWGKYLEVGKWPTRWEEKCGVVGEKDE